MNILETNYHYIGAEYDKKLTTCEYSCLRYYSKKAIRKHYLKGGYVVVGAIGEGLHEKLGNFQYAGKEKAFYTLQYAKMKYAIDGYVHIGNDKYLAVVKRCVGRNIFIAVATIAIAVLLIAGGAFLSKNDDIDPFAKDYDPPEHINIETDPNHIALPGYDTIKVLSGTDTAYVALWNPPNNPCYFKFEITSVEHGDVLYESKLIPPGQAVTEVKFNRKMKTDIEDIEIKIEAYSLDDKNVQMNGGVIMSKIMVIEE